MKEILKKVVLEIISPRIGRIARILRIQLRQPIIIVGTGRSGTTLLSRILSSHPHLVGFPEEANHLWHPGLEPFEDARIISPPIEIDPKGFTELSLQNWPQDHAYRIYDTFNGFHLLAGKTKSFFVKSAMISFMIPKIMEVFPDARFLHIYRNGPSVIESYFVKNYGKYSRYKYSQGEYYQYCARYWNDCILEIDRVKKELDLIDENRYLEFSYESLCNDPQGVLKHISNFLDVDLERFTFDLSAIHSQNYKVNLKEEKWENLMEIIQAGMELKGYTA